MYKALVIFLLLASAAFAQVAGSPGVTGGSSSSGSITGGSCTNQVTVSISTAGVPTCATVTSAFVNSTIETTAGAQAAFSGTGACTNQAVTGNNANAAPSCTTITSSYTSGNFPAAVVNGVSYPASPSTTTVPIVTSSNTVTYEKVPNGALNSLTGTDTSIPSSTTGSTTADTPACWDANGGLSATCNPAQMVYALDSSGSANTITISVPGIPASLATGICVAFKAANSTTGASVLQVTPTGGTTYGASIALDKRVTTGVAALGTSGDVVSGGVYQACYDGTEFVLGTTSSTVYSSGALVSGRMLLGNSGNQLATASNISASNSVFTIYNSETLAGNGMAYERGVTSQKAETGADSSVLAVTPASAAGTYCATFTQVLTAASSATIGWTVSWTDSGSNAQTPTNEPLFQSGTAAPALTFTTSAAGDYFGTVCFDVNSAGAAITVKTTFSGTSMTSKVSAVVERKQ